MGMSASQARFLSLTARKTNVEYEGQQINQQRTMLSNESSNYYSQLTSMTVPTPPSSADFSKTSYTFVNGNEKNTVTSLIAKADGTYILNYVQEVPVDAMVVQGLSIITSTSFDAEGKPNGDFYIGGSKLREGYVLPKTQTEPSKEDIENFKRTEKSIPASELEKMSDEQIKNLLMLESQYYGMLRTQYGENSNWYTRYQKSNSSSGYTPVFYNESEILNADYNSKTGSSLSGIKAYEYGETTETKEILNKRARVEQDSSGRYMNIVIYTDEDDQIGTLYELTTTTESDEAGYNDAMNQYYYDKAQYDKKIQEVNSKIEIIQVQDKNLELKLKQLDTEENAISTEMDAVKKVISKNVESSFKTFNA